MMCLLLELCEIAKKSLTFWAKETEMFRQPLRLIDLYIYLAYETHYFYKKNILSYLGCQTGNSL